MIKRVAWRGPARIRLRRIYPRTCERPSGVTLILGLYSASLTSALLVHQLRRNRPKLAVSCHFGYVKRRSDSPDDPENVKVVTIEAVNIGNRPVEARRAGFRSTEGEEVSVAPYLVEPARPPHLLGDGESIRFHFRADADLPRKQTAEVAEAFVCGGGDRRWSGPPDEWLRPLRVSRRWWRLPKRQVSECRRTETPRE